MELLQLKQRWATDAGLSLAPPSSFARPNTSASSRYIAASSRDNNNESFATSAVAANLYDVDGAFNKKRKRDTSGSNICPNVELEQQGPLPSGWQQCLDLQSGEMYYWNMGLKIKTRQDPRGFTKSEREKSVSSTCSENSEVDLSLNLSSTSSKCRTKCLPNEAKMVAAACKRCLMFVMLPETSPKCPNCGLCV